MLLSRASATRTVSRSSTSLEPWSFAISSSSDCNPRTPTK